MFARDLKSAAAQPTVIGLRDAKESLAEFVVVRSHQRIGADHARHADMVFKQHQITDFVSRVDTAGGVGKNDRADAKRFHHANRESDLRQTVTFVEVRAPLLRGHHLPFQLANDQIALMALHSGLRPARDFSIGHDSSMLQFVGQAAQARPEDKTNGRLQICPAADSIRRAFEGLTLIQLLPLSLGWSRRVASALRWRGATASASVMLSQLGVLRYNEGAIET